MSKALKILTAAVDVLLLIDIATDLWKKYKERRKAAKQNNTISPDTFVDDEPEPATVE